MGAAGKSFEGKGGRTIRPSARKIRNNKVYTSKGPRDRRLRLSAETAIQFYDVQDRLGYERASDAIDWLIDKAKGSIEKLSHTSSLQYEHLTHLGAKNGVLGGYPAECLSNRGESEEAIYRQNFSKIADNLIHSTSGYVCSESSVLYPQFHMANCGSDLKDRMSYTLEGPYYTTPSSPSSMKHDILPACRRQGQFLGRIMFNSKSNMENEGRPSVSSPTPLYLKSPILGHNDDLSVAYPASDLNLASSQCLAGFAATHEPPARGPFCAEAIHLYDQTRIHYQEQFVTCNHPSFFVPPSQHE